MSFLKSVATVGGWTSVSRILGFIRDVLIARFLGASMMADAFFVALRFPNLFRSFFAEGALNVAFIPIFSELFHTKGRTYALKFARQTFSVLFYILLSITVVMELIMPYIVFILAPGFDKIPGKLALTTSLTQITFPFLLCISLVSLMSGVLNAIGKFWIAAFVPIILNVCMILGLFGLSLLFIGEDRYAYGLAWSVFIAGVIEVMILLHALKKEKLGMGIYGIKILWQLPQHVKVLIKKMLPGLLGSGVYQINLFLDTFFVSFVGAGAISWLNYAHHLFQLPIGVIASALGTALLPLLSRHIKKGEKKEALYHLNRGLEVALGLSFASMIGLVILAKPIIMLLFEHGVFTALDTYHTSEALVIFSFGLPAYMITKSISPFFYAQGDTKTPVKIGIVGVIINTFLALILMQVWGYKGIACATTVSVWINAFQYIYLMHKKKELVFDDLFLFRWKRIIFSVSIMGIFLKIITLLYPIIENNFLSFFKLCVIILLAIGIFCAMLFKTSVLSRTAIRGSLWKTKQN